jgi:hypothetical protein
MKHNPHSPQRNSDIKVSGEGQTSVPSMKNHVTSSATEPATRSHSRQARPAAHRPASTTATPTKAVRVARGIVHEVLAFVGEFIETVSRLVQDEGSSSELHRPVNLLFSVVAFQEAQSANYNSSSEGGGVQSTDNQVGLSIYGYLLGNLSHIDARIPHSPPTQTYSS